MSPNDNFSKSIALLVALVLHCLHIKQMILDSGQKCSQYYIFQLMPEEKSFDNTIIAKNSYPVPNQEPGAKMNSSRNKLGCHLSVKSVNFRENARENPG